MGWEIFCSLLKLILAGLKDILAFPPFFGTKWLLFVIRNIVMLLYISLLHIIGRYWNLAKSLLLPIWWSMCTLRLFLAPADLVIWSTIDTMGWVPGWLLGVRNHYCSALFYASTLNLYLKALHLPLQKDALPCFFVCFFM